MKKIIKNLAVLSLTAILFSSCAGIQFTVGVGGTVGGGQQGGQYPQQYPQQCPQQYPSGNYGGYYGGYSPPIITSPGVHQH